MKIYISGPITGTDDYMERFDKAQKHLEAKGYEVVNPALVNSKLPKSTTYDEYMEMSFCMLRMCDTVCMLKGWENSEGATIEHNVAVRTSKEILYECDK